MGQKPRQPCTPEDLYPRATARGLEVHPATLKALALFSSQDETRVVMSGVGVDIPHERDQAWLCATDGHRAMRVPIIGTIPGTVRPAWNPVELAQAKLRAELHDVEGRSESGAVLHVLPWIGGEFISISRVIPQDHDKPQRRANLTLTWDPTYLGDVTRAAEIFGKACKRTSVVTVGAMPEHELSPIRWDVVVWTGKETSVVLAQVAIMPMRDSGTATLPKSHNVRLVAHGALEEPSAEPEAPDITKTDIPEIAKAKAKAARKASKRQPVAARAA